jgi:hypothetical protein
MVVDEEAVVVVEVPGSLVLIRQLLVEAAGDFDVLSWLSGRRFLSKTSFEHGPIYHIELLRRARKAL